MVGVVEAAHGRVRAAAGTAVHQQCGLPVRVAALLEVHRVTVAHIYLAGAIGLECRIEGEPFVNGHCVVPKLRPVYARSRFFSRNRRISRS